MANQVTNYKCPSCTGPLHYVGESGKLECDYCGSTFDVETIESLYADKDAAASEAQAKAEEKEKEAGEAGWDVSAAGGEWGEEAKGMKAYECPSCGAQLVCDETTAATSCPYCGNPTIIPGQFRGNKKPDLVIPFKLEKKQAIEALKEHYKGKFLLPKVFSSQNHVEEIKGVYVPFWLFDAKVEATASYQASNSTSHREGDYIVTTTQHYRAHRKGSMDFHRVPVDGSTKMPDDYMDSIEPFDYGELKNFSTAYLPGFLADKYDVDAEAASQRAEERCETSIMDSMEKTVKGYETVSELNRKVDIQRGDVKYALLPVWLLSTKWNDKNYLFAMNGQTGKMVGDLPVDRKKARLLFWGTAVAASALLSLLFSGPLGGMIYRFFM